MAEVDFGGSELFEQLDEDTPAQPVHLRFDEATDNEEEPSGIREQLAQCEETINQLRAENDELRRKLSMLSRPSGLSLDDKFNGPLLQILFMNHVVSKQYHQEIEDFITHLTQKYEEHQKSNPEKTSFNLKPQPSSILLEENGCSSVDTIKKIKDAFSVVGSVLYFTNFCLDKLGQPLLNENPQMTEGWEIPKYQQVFTQIVSLDGQEVQVKAKRPKPCCFNCGSEDHQMRDCSKPRDLAHINMKRKEFMDACGDSGSQNQQQRYHADEERFGKYKPGVISDELREALGISESCLPPFIYRMRQLGYPPGWLKETEMEHSGISLYDGKGCSDGELEDGESRTNKHLSYDVSKLISYPGFNTPAPHWMADDWQSFGSIPMQPAHHKEAFAKYLTHNFPAQSRNSNHKRASSSRTGSSRRKKAKSSGNHTEESPVDMDVESDVDMSYGSPPHKGFKFQPPLPPGSPSFGTPPPLPRGTPPSTPPNFIPPPPPTPTPPPLPKGTPPPTPTGASPMAQGRGGCSTQPQVVDSMDEDTLTLEELEEQQRLIWAALENAESANSDSDVHTPLTVSSAPSSPTRTELEHVTEGEGSIQKPGRSSDAFLEAIAEKPDDESTPLTPEDDDDEPSKKDNNIDCKVIEGNGSTVSINKEGSELNEEPTEEEACSVPSTPNSGIPDMSKFAAGITPFEYDNMAESTGVYLRLRNVLKNSPRNQQRGKNI
ncbi:zinc finger CCHC domain-containing protein 8 isoform X2 [Spea bombifrons]|uniref:zinc finger CCHC domain-containing protein 8 isoform X2 n=1 Tax=Spea bombifrons TaxID=233779 RepID=UPI002349A088|nr:zinc finger CCHC domain-containing protein 8 isoform X2 [Spea bombifrons]